MLKKIRFDGLKIIDILFIMKKDVFRVGNIRRKV